VNTSVVAWCSKQEITFARTRPSRKNDNCFVEQKNVAVVPWGYLRYETVAELEVLAQLSSISDIRDLLPTQMRLVERTREGARVRRRHDTAQTRTTAARLPSCDP
jgi:hypothetical protein